MVENKAQGRQQGSSWKGKRKKPKETERGGERLRDEGTDRDKKKIIIGVEDERGMEKEGRKEGKGERKREGH